MPAACDYLVIGSGAADAVVAAGLSDDPDIQVVLLEAGGRDNSLLLKLPGLGFAVGTHPRYYNWGHETAPVPGLMGRPELRICEAFSAAAAGMGFPILDDLNRDTVDGFGYYDINVGDGRRLSTATAFLRPNDSRVQFNRCDRGVGHPPDQQRRPGRGRGYPARGRPGKIQVNGEIIVSTGAIKSTQLLLLSGIGPGD